MLTNLIGKGLQADVYEYEGRAIKLFHDPNKKSFAFCEAALLALIEKTDLPSPHVYEIKRIEGHWAIIMDFIEGNHIADDMANHMEAFVDLQIKMNSMDVPNGLFMANSNDLCKNIIQSSDYLDPNTKERLLSLLASFAQENKLCHNDYHRLNVIKNDTGLHIIDWSSATGGSPLQDACRTYLLTLEHHKEYAEHYLSTYCARAKVACDDVLKWIPLIHAVNPGLAAFL